MIQNFGSQVTSQPQALEGFPVYLREHDGRMHLAFVKFRKLGQRQFGVLAVSCGCGQGDQDFVCVQTGILAAEISGLEELNRFNCGRRDDMPVMIDARKLFQRVQKKGRAGAQKVSGLFR